MKEKSRSFCQKKKKISEFSTVLSSKLNGHYQMLPLKEIPLKQGGIYADSLLLCEIRTKPGRSNQDEQVMLKVDRYQKALAASS